jgi:hypothetical protein
MEKKRMIVPHLIETKYAPAAAAVAEFEIWLRLLGDVFEIKQDLKSETLIDRLFDKNVVTDADKILLHNIRRLRNKVLHVAFPDARDIVVDDLDTSLAQGSVRVAKIGDVGNVLNVIQDPNQWQHVRDLSQKDARIAGWLMESSTSGLFDEVTVQARKAIERIQQLFPNE